MMQQTNDHTNVNLPDPTDRQFILEVLLRRARRQLADDVHRGLFTQAQSQGLLRATERRYTKRLGLPLLLTA
jgi:hypothetical protein